MNIRVDAHMPDPPASTRPEPASNPTAPSPPSIAANLAWTHTPEMAHEAQKAVAAVIARGEFVLGSQVSAFEEEFRGYLGAPSGVGVASGTDAITLALLAGGVGVGDEVIIPSFAPGPVAVGVLACGATPVLAEVNDGLSLEETMLPALLTRRTKAIIVVHLYGKTAPMNTLCAWASSEGLWIVEDCAHAHGAFHPSIPGDSPTRAGMIGDAAAFSFYPTKNLACIGDGGFCASRHARLQPTLASLRQYGWMERNFAVLRGRNSRLDEVQAAVLRVGLPHLDARNERRRTTARRYIQNLRGNLPESVLLPRMDTGTEQSVFHQFVIQTPLRAPLIHFLSQRAIGSGVHYPLALHQQHAFGAFARDRSFPVAERLASTVLSLPLYPELREEDCDRVCDQIRTFWNAQ